MKIGVISDTHHNEEYTLKVVEHLSKDEHVKKIYHLGDEWEDLAAAQSAGLPVVMVPGIYADEYKDPAIPNSVSESVSGKKILLLHDLNDMTDDEAAEHDVILHGHTHSYELRCHIGKLYLNPGHLKERFHKERIATFMVIKFGEKGVKAKLFDIDFNFVAKISFYTHAQ